MIAEALRVAASLVVTTLIGCTYYNPNMNPLVKKWLQCQKPTKHSDGMMRELCGTWVANGLIAIFILHFTDGRAFMMMDVLHMAVKMTFVAEALQFVHCIWKQASLPELAVNAVYDFLILFAITFVVTFNRYG